MATASRGDVITLNLEDDEAKVLAIILGAVGGSPEQSKRGISDKIMRALESIGYGDIDPHCHTGDFMFKKGQ